MTNDGIELTRRKVLAGLGAVGAAGAGAGMGTSALFSDTESVQNNSLVAGTLDLKVDWEEHYYNGSAAPANGENVSSLRRVDGADDVTDSEVGLPDPENPIVAVDEADLDEFMQASTAETGGPTSNPDPGPIELSDVKPGDFGEVTFSYRLLDNPGYVTLEAAVTEDAENGVTEPEKEVDSSSNASELGEKVQAALWYDPDCDNVLDSEEAPVVRGTLNEVLAFLGADPPDPGVSARNPLVLDPTDSGGRLADEFGSEYCHKVVDSSVDCSERFYFTNVDDADGTDIFGTPDDDTTILYEAELVDTDSDVQDDQAEITSELYDFSDDDGDEYDHIVSIAASADGERVYVIDKFSNHLGVYDVPGDSFDDIGAISGAPNKSLQAAVSPDGALYFTVFGGSNLYVIEDPDNSTTVDKTIQMTDQNGDPIEVGGSDIAFLSNGTLYLVDKKDTGSTADLYRFSDPSTGVGEKVGDLDSSINLPGIAVRASGSGNLIGIDTNNHQFYELDPADGSEVATYPTFQSDGTTPFKFAEAGGDMTVGPLCPTHCVALAWWVPRDVGNEIQSDRFAFDVTFRAEQCRNNAKLVNHWPLDSVDDRTAEDVVGTSDGTVQPGVSPANNAQVGSGAASFEGTDDYVTLPQSFDGEAASTVSLWAKTTSGANDEYAAPFASSGPLGGTLGSTVPKSFQIDVSGDGKWRINGNFSPVDIGLISSSGFDHVVVTIEGGTIRGYLNGSKEVDFQASNYDVARYRGAAIGANRNRNVLFDGVVDDVRVYDQALSESAVQDLYDATK